MLLVLSCLLIHVFLMFYILLFLCFLCFLYLSYCSYLYFSVLLYGFFMVHWLFSLLSLFCRKGITMNEGSKRAKVREMEYSIDKTAEHLGLIRIDLEPERTPAEQLALEIINDPSMHSHGSDIQWWQLPHAIAIGKVKAEATRNKWQHGRIIDGRRVRFQSIAFREKNGDAWGVAIAYDPDKQPKQQEAKNIVAVESATESEPPLPQPDGQQQPSFDGGTQFI